MKWTSELHWPNKRYNSGDFDICGYSTENYAEKLSSDWLTLRQNLLILSQIAENLLNFRHFFQKTLKQRMRVEKYILVDVSLMFEE